MSTITLQPTPPATEWRPAGPIAPALEAGRPVRPGVSRRHERDDAVSCRRPTAGREGSGAISGPVRSWAGVMPGDGDEVLPAPGAPFSQVRPLRAQGGVVPVPGVDPCRVGQPAEDLTLHAAHQAVEILGLCRLPRTARE